MEKFKQKMIALLNSKNLSDIEAGILGLTMNEVDYKLAESTCIKYSTHSDEWLRKIAMEGVEHIFRVYTDASISVKKLLMILENGIKDKSSLVSGASEDYLQGARHFIQIRKLKIDK